MQWLDQGGSLTGFECLQAPRGNPIAIFADAPGFI